MKKPKIPRIRRQARRVSKAGLPPGSLVYVGEKKLDQACITFLDYDEGQFTEKQVPAIEACFPLKDTPTVSWINIDGLHDVSIFEKLGHHFDIHALLLEDILNTHQRPKLDEAQGHLLVILKMLRWDETMGGVLSEQVSIVLGSTYVISFQENIGDVFDPIRDRIRHAKGKIRKHGPDYLLYTLLDAVVDGYFAILERIGERIEALEEELVTEPTQRTLHRIHDLKREMIFLRRSIWPLRELCASLDRDESELIQADTGLYLRDVYDHTIQVIDTVEGFRDTVSSMLDLYLSSISHHMNKVMQVLTITATLFIPLTFVAGIYGMNFENMPELKWKYGYAAVWGVMLVMAIGMLVYFKRKKWL